MNSKPMNPSGIKAIAPAVRTIAPTKTSTPWRSAQPRMLSLLERPQPLEAARERVDHARHTPVRKQRPVAGQPPV